ncbi:hypothetical protein OG589_14710 [Sphaerisporangium sp. NBC_01403]|uniref:hypothetical protein n=1 Tax=Sphaerisporangium sp. NBC_01403 TaxID=2903599 RepID=UPI0032464F4C
MAKKTTAPATDSLFSSSELSELDQAREDIKGLSGELTRLNDRYMLLLKERGAWERSVRSAAGRAAWDRVAFSYSYYLVGKVKEPFGLLCGRIEMLPERPKPDQIERLKWAAADLRKELSKHDNDTSGLVAEVTRLRDIVQTQAKNLHERFGNDRAPLAPGGQCECPGCELVRSLDDEVVSEAESEHAHG